MRNDFNSNYLEHHGILGMKWGQRNGPPYPLGSEDHSASEKKAGWKKSLSGGAETVKKKAKTAKEILRSDSGARSSKALKDARRKNMDELSTAELREINNRLNEEQRYLNLTRGMTSDGKKFAKEISKNIGAAIITNIAIEVGKKYVKAKLGIA